MIRLAFQCLLLAAVLLPFPGFAQESPERVKVGLETRITSYLQGGYEGQLFFTLPGARLSVGIGVGGQNVAGRAKELLFTSSNYNNLAIRLPWLAAGTVRYHLSPSLEGFYGEVSVGGEQFRVRSGQQTQRVHNGFVVPGVGYRWFPWGKTSFYVNPKIGGIFTFAREPERTINETTYRLRPFFPSPGLSLGWQFE